MREQHNVPLSGRKTSHLVIGPPISPVVGSVSLSVSLRRDSLTGLLFLFIASVTVLVHSE